MNRTVAKLVWCILHMTNTKKIYVCKKKAKILYIVKYTKNSMLNIRIEPDVNRKPNAKMFLLSSRAYKSVMYNSNILTSIAHICFE